MINLPLQQRALREINDALSALEAHREISRTREKRLRATLAETIQNARNAGLNRNEIARYMGITGPGVSNLLRRNRSNHTSSTTAVPDKEVSR